MLKVRDLIRFARVTRNARMILLQKTTRRLCLIRTMLK